MPPKLNINIRLNHLILLSFLLIISSCSTSNLSVGTIRTKHRTEIETNTPAITALTSTDTGRDIIAVLTQIKTGTFFPGKTQVAPLKEIKRPATIYKLAKKGRLRNILFPDTTKEHKDAAAPEDEKKNAAKYQSMGIASAILAFTAFTLVAIGLAASLTPLILIAIPFSIVSFVLGLIALAHHNYIGMAGVILGGLIVLIPFIVGVAFLIYPEDGP